MSADAASSKPDVEAEGSPAQASRAKNDDRPTPKKSLAAHRKKVLETLTRDFQIPDYEDVGLYARFRPAEPAEVRSAWRRREKAGDEASFMAHADVLIDCCQGLYILDENDNEIPPTEDEDPTLPRFDERLAEAIGEPDLDRSIDVVRALFVRPFQVIAMAQSLLEWSGMNADDIEERVRGN